MLSTPVFEFLGVGKSYPQDWFGRALLPALRDITLRVNPGEAIGLVGPNRAGKTTLVKILLSLCAPSTGQARRFGRPLTDRSTLARVGYVHESPAFPRYLNARELLQYYGALSLLPEPVVTQRTEELLKRVGLADRSREPIARFSKGMVQRLALAQALLNDPELLVLDEPAEGLDLTGRRLLHDIVRDSHAQGSTVLLVSHLLGEVEELCDRVVVLNSGRVVRDSALAALHGDAAEGSVRSLSQILQPDYEAACS
jgi:ABC-2 type transport system ATP-binding protein